MKCKTKREFIPRNFPRRYEARPTARVKINKKKYYGVRVDVNKYKKDIFDHFYDESLLRKISRTAGDVRTKADQYLFQVASTYDELKEKARSILGDVFRKGSKRVLDNSGDTIKLDEPVDENSVNVLTNQQTEYYQNLTKAQAKKINQIIAQGTEDGDTDQQISENIRKGIKKLSSKRALRIARTEVVKTHSVAQTDTMLQAGIDKYNYITSNDKKVSKICRKNQGPKGRERIYETALAGTPSNPLPVINSHPNCRCTPVAYIPK